MHYGIKNGYNELVRKTSLRKYVYISIAAALATIVLKTVAYLLTGSIGLFSDALESGINLVAAVVALITLGIAEKPPDKMHAYGHTKAEYFSSVIEGILIIVASISIGYAAVGRIISPQPIEKIGMGLLISFFASVVNGYVGILLLRAGKKNNSIILEADGKHLLTDVWTSAGVIAAVAFVAITGLQIFDPVVALVVAGNILFTGFGLMSKSISGLMDSALPQNELKEVEERIKKYCQNGITYHGLLTRQSATRRFISFHLLVPGSWSIQKGHDVMERIEKDLRNNVRNISVIIHIEPIEDPKSQEDILLDRK